MVSLEARGNCILGALPQEEFRRVSTDLRMVHLSQGTVLYEWLTVTDEILFPTSAIVSMVTLMEDGQSVESVLAGVDTISGAWVACGVHRAPWRVVVQSAGHAFAMDTAMFSEHLAASPVLRRLVLRAAVAGHFLTSQSVGCNRFHDLASRAARWLLMVVERTGSTQVRLTQEFLSQMLGAHRPSVTVALGVLEHRGLIARTRRGIIDVLDIEALEGASCECYRKVREYSARMLDLDAPL
ncbi:MAG: Crp/Fnr family transcriptional regulator [Dehalococcoidia bacterium]